VTVGHHRRVKDGQLGALLCDVDGVLRLWDGGAAARLEREYELPAGAIAAAAFATDRLVPAITGRITDEEWRADIARCLTPACGSGRRASQVVEEWSRPMGRVDGEVLGLLALVRRSVPVVLVSNATTRLERDLRLLGVADVLSDVVSSARIGAAKPDPAIYVTAAELAGVAPDRCLFVDDTPANVQGAEALGMAGLIYRGVAGLRLALEPVL